MNACATTSTEKIKIDKIPFVFGAAVATCTALSIQYLCAKYLQRALNTHREREVQCTSHLTRIETAAHYQFEFDDTFIVGICHRLQFGQNAICFPFGCLFTNQKGGWKNTMRCTNWSSAQFIPLNRLMYHCAILTKCAFLI